jgi:predicted CxxxxCH...CXXCH cytochrome family protein
MRIVILAATVALFTAAAGCGTSRPAEGSDAGCGSCHGFPPVTLTAGGAHPQPAPSTEWVASDCSPCHATSIDATGAIVPGGTHADGTVDAGHGSDYATDLTVHGPFANRSISSCQACHGATLGGAGAAPSCNACHAVFFATDWQTNCTFCHGTYNAAYTAANLPEAAPPEDVGGATATTEVTVGAHQAHVTATVASPLECSACHSVTTPADIFSTGHIDASPAEVPFGAVASAGGRTPIWDRTGATCSSTWCHDQGGSTPAPVWTTGGALGCGACHLAAPDSGKHSLHSAVKTCGDCHAGFTSTTVDPALHVDGLFNIPKLPTAACHPFSGGPDYGTSCDGRSDW